MTIYFKNHESKEIQELRKKAERYDDIMHNMTTMRYHDHPEKEELEEKIMKDGFSVLLNFKKNEDNKFECSIGDQEIDYHGDWNTIGEASAQAIIGEIFKRSDTEIRPNWLPENPEIPIKIEWGEEVHG